MSPIGPPPRPEMFDQIDLSRRVLAVEVAAVAEGDDARWAVVVREVDGPEIGSRSGRLSPGTKVEASLEAVRFGLDVVAETDPAALISIRGSADVVGHLTVTTELPQGAAEALLTDH